MRLEDLDEHSHWVEVVVRRVDLGTFNEGNAWEEVEKGCWRRRRMRRRKKKRKSA